MYHGTPAERTELRRTKMIWHEDDPSSRVSVVMKTAKKNGIKRSTLSTTNLRRESKHHSSPSTRKEEAPRRSTRFKTAPSRFKSNQQPTEGDDGDDDGVKKSDIPDDDSDADNDTLERNTLVDETASDEAIKDDEDGTRNSINSQRANDTFPIILTTYEMIIKDRQHLSKYKWNFIVVDEGHRLKNMDCKCVPLLLILQVYQRLLSDSIARLMQEIKKYDSANRLILTGTPLHVRGYLFISHSCHQHLTYLEQFG